mmetsp:Transcript_19978/g.37268  ORF Transcript_19978/g.37268 Transcript_19978/m.37268 type:complete len:331 (+) Transcript_19978:76-1068(+)
MSQKMDLSLGLAGLDGFDSVSDDRENSLSGVHDILDAVLDVLGGAVDEGLLEVGGGGLEGGDNGVQVDVAVGVSSVGAVAEGGGGVAEAGVDDSHEGGEVGDAVGAPGLVTVSLDLGHFILSILDVLGNQGKVGGALDGVDRGGESDTIEGEQVLVKVHRQGPVPVVVHVEELLATEDVIFALERGVPSNADFRVVVGDVRSHVAVVVLDLRGPYDVLRAIDAIALHNDVAESDDLISGVIGTGECLLVDNVGKGVLLAVLGLDDLAGGIASLNASLRQGVRIAGGVVDEAALQGVATLDIETGAVAVVGRTPLVVLSVSRPGSSTEAAS